MKASDLFVKALENEGVEYIFAVPGEENLDILDSLRNSLIKLILTRHEQGAGFMAATYGRMTGKPGVCMATLGPGATNLVTPAAYAYLGAMPMVMITGQKPIKKSKQGQFQICDIVEMMKPITKYAKQVIHGNTIPTIIRESFRLAIEERPGSVHIEVPEDIAREETNTHLMHSSVPRRPSPDDKAITKAISMIESSKRPLLLIGAGANRKRISKELLNFIDKTGIYFFNTQMGKGVIDERHPLFIGTSSLSDNDYVHCAIDRSDLIINVCHDVIEKPPFFMEEGGKKVIHVNFFSAQIDEIYFPQLEIIGDVATSVNKITNTIKKANWDVNYFSKVKKEVDKHVDNEVKISPDLKLVTPQQLVRDVRAALPDDGVLTLDNGVYKIWFARNFRAYTPNSVLLDNALATMGAGLPSGIMCGMLYPDKPVISVCGDGGFMMNSQEIETAVRLGINMTLIVLKDNAYGMIKWKQSGMGLSNFGLDYGNPDFVKYAESYGATGIRLEKASDLRLVLTDSLSKKGFKLLEVPVDYSENEKVLIEELKSRTCIL